MVLHAQYSSVNLQCLYRKHNWLYSNLFSALGLNKHDQIDQIKQYALNYLFYIPVSSMERSHGATTSHRE